MARTRITPARPDLTDATLPAPTEYAPAASGAAVADKLEHGTGTSKLTFTAPATGEGSGYTVTVAQSNEGLYDLSVSYNAKHVLIMLPSDDEGTPINATANQVKTAYDALKATLDNQFDGMLDENGDPMTSPDSGMPTLTSGGAGNVATTDGELALDGGHDGSAITGVKIVKPRNLQRLALLMENEGEDDVTVTLLEGTGPGRLEKDMELTVPAGDAIGVPQLDGSRYCDANGDLNMDIDGALLIRAWRVS